MSKGAHFRHRADANHWQILAALKKVTAVRDIHNCPGGIGDILARHTKTGEAVFLEVKASPKDHLTAAEEEFSFDFWANWARVHTVDEALWAIGLDM